MNSPPPRSQLIPILQALFVTFLWATSWILIKPTLDDIPPITFAGLRYSLAFVALLVIWLFRGGRTKAKALTKQNWGWLIAYGIVFYALTQASGFIAIGEIPAATFSLTLNFSAVLVAFLGWLLLGEKLRAVQWLGVAVFLIGILVYFWPLEVPADQVFGMLVAIFSMVGVSISVVMGRFINRAGKLDSLTITVISMGVGAAVMLLVGLAVEPAPILNLTNMAILVWLAVINTAVAFTLWNHTQRFLTAMQSNIINNSMLVQIALLAWLFLAEVPTSLHFLGMGIVLTGVILVNWQKVK